LSRLLALLLREDKTSTFVEQKRPK